MREQKRLYFLLTREISCPIESRDDPHDSTLWRVVREVRAVLHSGDQKAEPGEPAEFVEPSFHDIVGQV
ncbi:MAG: hypothetical protein P8N43_12170 [Alphaproteobacteria bacterium]|nr:hypothetical protein [Alphaproteobacteria bacterium]